MAIKEFRRPYDYTPGQTKEVIQGEEHTIPVSPPYDIYLIHIPRKETPSTVRIPGFTEVDGPPSPGQYRVHYEEPGSDPLGRVEFHASDAGKLVAVDYHACGTVIWAEDRGDGRPNIAEMQEVLERVQEAGGIDYGSSGFANVKAALDALAGVRIVEMGSNSNGEYVRWENGLQVCWHWWTQHPYGGLTYLVRSGNVTWTYPAAFAAVPATMVQGRPGYWEQPWQDASHTAEDYGGLSITPSIGSSPPSSTGVRVVYWYRMYGGRLDMFAFAIGRWK